MDIKLRETPSRFAYQPHTWPSASSSCSFQEHRSILFIYLNIYIFGRQQEFKVPQGINILYHLNTSI